MCELDEHLKTHGITEVTEEEEVFMGGIKRKINLLSKEKRVAVLVSEDEGCSCKCLICGWENYCGWI